MSACDNTEINSWRINLDKKGRTVRLVVFLGIVTLVCIVSYSVYRYRAHLQNIINIRSKDSIEFFYDVERKYE